MTWCSDRIKVKEKKCDNTAMWDIKHCVQQRQATIKFPNCKVEESPCLSMMEKWQEEQKGKEENKSSWTWWHIT